MDYIDKSIADGFFSVSTPEELASYCYVVNTQPKYSSLPMELKSDIDLSEYKWAPMGWNVDLIDRPFVSQINSNGHTIKGLRIVCNDWNIGFIGWGVDCTVSDISVEDASTGGSGNVGIVAGQANGGTYKNITASGDSGGNRAGTVFGYERDANIVNCKTDATVNNVKFNYLSWSKYDKNETIIDNPVTITLEKIIPFIVLRQGAMKKSGG